MVKDAKSTYMSKGDLMKNILFTFIAIFLFNTLSINESYAFRCGGEITTRGDYSHDLRSKCGEPTQKEFAWETIDGKLRPVEIWLYNCGDQDFVYKLTILHSKIIKDEPTIRGSGPSQCLGAVR